MLDASHICSGVHAKLCQSGMLLVSAVVLSPPVQPLRILLKEYLIALLLCGQSCAQHFASCGWVQWLCRVHAAHSCILAIAHSVTAGFSICGMLPILQMQVQGLRLQCIWSSSGRSSCMHSVLQLQNIILVMPSTPICDRHAMNVGSYACMKCLLHADASPPNISMLA